MFKLKATPTELRLAGDFMQGKAPLSFTYDGIPFPEGFTCEKGICASADGKLKFSFPYETYEDSAAVEWLPRFDCIGEEKTAQASTALCMRSIRTKPNRYCLSFDISTAVNSQGRITM